MGTSGSRNHTARLLATYRRYFSRSLWWPSGIDIELTNRCNLSCGSCWFHGENGVGDRYMGAEMDTGEVLRFIDQVAPHRPALYFGGAEPLMRQDFPTIAAHAKHHDLRVALTTNGTLLTPEVSEQLVAAGVDDISVSIDGPERIHDRLRGGGNFDRTLSHLCALLENRRSRGVERPTVTVNITVNHEVVGSLKETISTVRDASGDRVDSYRIHHLWVVSADEFRSHQEAVHEALGCWAPGAGSHRLSSVASIDVRALADEITRLRGADKLTSLPDLWGAEIGRFYAEGRLAGKTCKAPFRRVVVKPNGDVRFCPDEWIDDYLLGNVRETDLGQIWRNRRARCFRRALVARGSFPACGRCSWSAQ